MVRETTQKFKWPICVILMMPAPAEKVNITLKFKIHEENS
jgi:hypothetical protein